MPNNNEKQIVGRLYTYNHVYELDLMVQILEAKFYEKNSYCIIESQKVVNISLSETNHKIFASFIETYLREFEKELQQSIETEGYGSIFTTFLIKHNLFPDVNKKHKNSKTQQYPKIVRIYAAVPTEVK